MNSKRLAALLLGAALAGLAAAPAALAQTPAEVALKARFKAPRNALGQPSLEGVWTNATLTPSQRDAKWGDKLVMSEAEAIAIEQSDATAVANANKPTNPDFKVTDLPHDCGRGFTGVNCGYNSFWVDPGTKVLTVNGERRTSIYTTPNGRTPPMKAQHQEAMRSRFAALRNRGSNDGPETRSLGERCIMSFGSSAGPPMLPLLYNNTYQIVQTPNEVMILIEMVHDVRVIRLNGEHGPAGVKTWMGDSIGRWDGDTLVIDTVNMRPEQSFRSGSDSRKITERLTRVSPTEILYSFKVEDEAYEYPLTGELTFNATKGPIYEYACHEGNHALPGILRGARVEEAEAAKKAAAGKPAASGGTP